MTDTTIKSADEVHEALRVGINRVILDAFPTDGEIVMVDLHITASALTDALASVFALMPTTATPDGVALEVLKISRRLISAICEIRIRAEEIPDTSLTTFPAPLGTA